MSKRILFADDSTAARTSVEQILGTADYQILAAEDGRSAMDQINSERPHLVLAHAILPEIDGYEVCRQVKESPDTSHIPVLLLTGTFEPFDINRAKEVRYDGFVTKPLDGPELLALVARCIDSAVYPADPLPEEVPEPVSEPETEVEAVEDVVFADVTPEAGSGSGSDAMLDRIFPEETGEELAADAETVTITESSDDDLFAIVEPEETVTESGAETEKSEAHDSTSFGIWGESRESGADEILVEEAPTAAEDEDSAGAAAGDEKPEVEDEDSDLSWFLRKYEEKQQRADVETEEPTPEPLLSTEDEPITVTPEMTVTAAEPFSMETEDDLPAGEEPAVDGESESPAAEETDPGKEAVEPLPVDVESVITDQATPPLDLDDQQLERISRRVVELLSESVIRDVAWEAVPEIAERLIRERIRDIEAEAETAD